MVENFNPYQPPPSPSAPWAVSAQNERFEKKPLTFFDWAAAITKGVFACGASFIATSAGLLPSAGIFWNGWVLVSLLGFSAVFSIAFGVSNALKQIHQRSYHNRVIYRSWFEELLFNVSIGLITLMVALPVTGVAVVMLRNNWQDATSTFALLPSIGALVAVAVSVLVAWVCWQPLFPEKKSQQRSAT